MATEQAVRRVGKAISRRRLLATAGAGALSFTYAMLGLAQPAHATIKYKCCNLCRYPAQQYCRSQGCNWGWSCCYGSQKWRCFECHYGGGYCGDGCINLNYSAAALVGSC
jgi:hypothetical protein